MADKPYARYDTRTPRYLRTQDAGIITDILAQSRAWCYFREPETVEASQ